MHLRLPQQLMLNSFMLLSINRRWQLASAEAERELQRQKDGPGVLLESFTLGWFNLVLQVMHLATALTCDGTGGISVK